MTVEPVLALVWNAAVGVPLLIFAVVVFALIWFFGQPRKPQGRRRAVAEAPHPRREPTMQDEDITQTSLADEPVFTAPPAPLQEDSVTLSFRKRAGATPNELDIGLRDELEKLGATLAGDRHPGAPAREGVTPTPPSRLSSQAASIVEALRSPTPFPEQPVHAPPGEVHDLTPPLDERHERDGNAAPAAPAAAPRTREVPPSDLGKRPPQLPVERIVTLFVVARENQPFHGPDLIVAAEKAGLEFGDMGIFHRLLDGKRELGPVFSVANMLKPGNFDLARLESLRTPGLSFFMTLPAPLSALDAWDAMLPAAQRMAELLDGRVLDEERSALGRQRIAHLRDELRGWDREHEGEEVVIRPRPAS